MGLLAHKDTVYASETEALAIPQPEWTPTWHPIAHSIIIEALQGSVKNLGLEVRSKAYSLNRSGTKMFGVWNLYRHENPNITPLLGFRNSIDKSLALGLSYGTHVFVCDNMAFSGDYVEFRRHTQSLTPEYLFEKFIDILPGVVHKSEEFLNWHTDLKSYELSYSDFRLLTFSAMDYRIIAPSTFTSFVEAYREENEATLYGFHGAVTGILRGRPLDVIASRTERLNDLIREFMRSRGYLGNPAEAFIDECKAGYFDPVDMTYQNGSGLWTGE